MVTSEIKALVLEDLAHSDIKAQLAEEFNEQSLYRKPLEPLVCCYIKELKLSDRLLGSASPQLGLGAAIDVTAGISIYGESFSVCDSLFDKVCDSLAFGRLRPSAIARQDTSYLSQFSVYKLDLTAQISMLVTKQHSGEPITDFALELDLGSLSNKERRVI